MLTERRARLRSADSRRSARINYHVPTSAVQTLLLTGLILLPAFCGRAAKPKPIPFQGQVLGEARMPIVGVKVVARGSGQNASAITDESGSYVIQLMPDANGRVTTALTSETDDGEIGIMPVDDIPKAGPFGIMGAVSPIVLSPGRPLTVEVRDELGEVVKDADVAVLFRLRTIAAGRTDAKGIWRCRVPANLKQWGVTARKSKFGFDYAMTLLSAGSPKTSQVVRSIPERLTLTLDGALSITVRAVDQDGKPVAGVPVSPRMIKKVGRESFIPLDESAANWPVTDAEGVLTLDWLPRRFEGSLEIDAKPVADLYPVNEGNRIYPQQIPKEITFTLLPFEQLGGRVLYSDGSPAAGIPISARGQGKGINGFVGSMQTDAQGCYQFRACCEQIYAVHVASNQWAAPARTGIVLKAGNPVTNVDFKLIPPTRVHGRVVIKGTNVPPKFAFVSAELLPTDAAKPATPGKSPSRLPSIYWHGNPDAEGRYELFLGPGEYEVRGPRETEPFKLSIPAVNPPTEVEHDFILARADTGPFLARIVDAQGKRMRHAIVDAHYESFKAGRMIYRSRTDSRGEMQFDRELYPMVMYAQSDDKQQAGLARFATDLTQGDVVVRPAAMATGRLVDAQGEPLANIELSYGIRIPLADGPYPNYSMDRLGGRLTTDAEGGFRLEGLVVNETYHLVLQPSGVRRDLKKIKPKAAGTLDLGAVQSNPSRSQPGLPASAGSVKR
jgi:hypothetical protein